MKLIRIVKLARVRYGDLEDGDRFMFSNSTQFATAIHEKDRGGYSWNKGDTPCKAYDTTKYPPESVTYNIEGIDDGAVDWGRGGVVIDRKFFPGSEIETRYE